jgi:hypothetical protein
VLLRAGFIPVRGVADNAVRFLCLGGGSPLVYIIQTLTSVKRDVRRVKGKSGFFAG